MHIITIMKKKVPTYLHWPYYKNKGFPGSSAGKESTCNAGHHGSIPGSGSSRDRLPTPYSWASLMVQMVKNPLQCRRPGFDPWVGKIPWRRTLRAIPGFLLGEFHGQRSLAGYSPWGRKELDKTEWLSTLRCKLSKRKENLTAFCFNVILFCTWYVVRKH